MRKESFHRQPRVAACSQKLAILTLGYDVKPFQGYSATISRDYIIKFCVDPVPVGRVGRGSDRRALFRAINLASFALGGRFTFPRFRPVARILPCGPSAGASLVIVPGPGDESFLNFF